jgi:quercetin dioxygenase-like cupin family protein
MAVGPLLCPDRGDWLAIGGYDIAMRVMSSATNDAYSVAEYRLEPRRLVPPHTHAREQEVSYVLKGELALRIGDTEIAATPGCIVVKPVGVPHTFWNPTERSVRVLEIISPGGFDSYFRELAALYTDDRLPEPHAVADLRDRYGVTAHPEWIDDLKTRHGLKLLGE